MMRLFKEIFLLTLISIIVSGDVEISNILEGIAGKKQMGEYFRKHTVEIKVSGATFTGTKMKSHSGRDIHAFQGIPYVNKPDRFQKPDGVKTDYGAKFDATAMKSQCLQASRYTVLGKRQPVGNEDCLFINVYKPVTNERVGKQNLLPVMVFIHGGQFVYGDAFSYMPTSLLDEDVVLVTFHYRLGALGFYSYGSQGEYPGNLALYDQQFALRWVQEHISNFGGKKTEVTLFGQDAGSISALYHLLTGNNKYTISKGNEIELFNAVIAQSGSPLDPFAFDQNGDRTAKELGIAAGCENHPDGITACMLVKPESELAMAAENMALTRPVHFPFLAPRIERSPGIVNKAPFDLILDGSYDRLPLMLGTCAQEGSFIFGVFYSDYLAPEGKDTDKEYLQFEMVPDMVNLAGIVDPLEFVASSLYETYLQDVDRTKLSAVTPGMIDMTGSLFSKAGILETAKLLYENYLVDAILGGTKKSNNIYLYSFEYKGKYSVFPDLFEGIEEKPNFKEEEIGITHGDDLLYLLVNPSLRNKNDEQTMKTMVKMWANFATTHNPTPTLGEIGEQWKSFSLEKQEYFSISEELEAKEGYEDCYTILVDEDDGGVSTTPGWNFTITTTPPLPTTTTPDPDMKCSCEDLRRTEDDLRRIEDDLSDALDERTAYLITMIVFIVLFVVAAGFAFYFFYKGR